MKRRSFITALAALLAAPFAVKAKAKHVTEWVWVEDVTLNEGIGGCGPITSITRIYQNNKLVWPVDNDNHVHLDDDIITLDRATEDRLEFSRGVAVVEGLKQRVLSVLH